MFSYEHFEQNAPQFFGRIAAAWYNWLDNSLCMRAGKINDVPVPVIRHVNF